MAEKRTVELNIKTNNKDVQSQFDNLRKSIEKTTQEVEDLSKEFGDNSQEADKARQELGKLTLAYDSLSKSATDLNAKFEDVYGELQPLTARMGEAEDRLYELALAGKQGTKEYNDLLQAVSGYRKVQMQTDMVVDAAATTMNQKLLGAVGGVAAGFEVAEGASALFGVESEDLQKTMVKLQAVMSISNGIQEVANALQAKSALMQTLNSAATKAASIAQGAYALVVGTTTGALKAFRIALATTGIGAIVVLLGMAASAMNLFGNSTEDAEAKQKELEKQLEKTNLEIERSSKLYEDIAKTIDTVSQQELINAKKRGASEEELNKIKKDGVKRRIDLAQEEVDEAQKRYLKYSKSGTTKQFEAAEKTWKEKSEKLTALKLQIEDEEADKIYDKRKGNQEKLNDLRNSELEKIKQFQLEASEANAARNRRTFEQEIYLINQKYDEQVKLAKKYKKDTTQIEQARANEIADVRKNNADLNVHLETTALNKIAVARTNQTTQLAGALNQQVELERQAAEQKIKILEAQAVRAQKIDENANSFKVKSVQQGLEIVSSLTELFGKKSEKNAKRAFQVQKAAQVASALINTYQSATGAYASQFLPVPDPTSPVRGGIAAGLAVAAGLVNVAKIASQKFEGGSTGGGGGTSGGNVPDSQMAAPQFNTIGTSGINQLATLQQQPTKAYVVSGEVTSAQSLDRNRLQNATL